LAEGTIIVLPAVVPELTYEGMAVADGEQTLDATGNASLEPDPVAGPLVTKAFELFAGGLHKQSEVRAKVTGLGLRTRTGKKLASQSFQNMLKNPIYSGWLQVKSWGVKAKATFKPLVYEDTFEQVRGLLTGSKTSLTPKHRNHPDFPLRRFVLCHSCGRPLTGSWSRGRRGGRYAYYRCPSSGCGSVNVRREQLEMLFVEVLEGLKPRPEVLKLFHEVVLDVWKQRQQNTAELRLLAQRRLDELKHRKNRLVEVFVYKPSTKTPTRRNATTSINRLLLPRSNIWRLARMRSMSKEHSASLNTCSRTRGVCGSSRI
jgi:hypothetical protein